VNPTALMEACRENFGVVMGGSAETGFIFPQLHPGFDAMLAIAKLIELLTLQDQTIGQLRAELPLVYYQTQMLRCPWNRKGSLMRHLVETHPPEQLELIDGVKIKDAKEPDNWILILPDAGEPLIRLVANGRDRNWVDTTLKEYGQRLQNIAALEDAMYFDLEPPV
jgi:mannose-1-phosphate guanylyltransferase / phosphomannomutase